MINNYDGDEADTIHGIGLGEAIARVKTADRLRKKKPATNKKRQQFVANTRIKDTFIPVSKRLIGRQRVW